MSADRPSLNFMSMEPGKEDRQPDQYSGTQVGAVINMESVSSIQERIESHAGQANAVTASTTSMNYELTATERADYQLAIMFEAQQNGLEALPEDIRDAVYDGTGKAPEPWECTCGDIFGVRELNQGEFILLNCGHARCMDCLNENISIGLALRKNFPPRCCGPIDLDDIMQYLRPDIIRRWNDVREEYADPTPVYCGMHSCSRYLSKNVYVRGQKWARCDACNVETCTMCIQLRSHHEGIVCPERLDKLNQDLMRREGWRACPNCRHIIEKAEGCNHTQCECGHEFCYLCGESYRGGLPCNCQGQNEWVEDEPDEDDEEMQRQILNEILEAARAERESKSGARNDRTDSHSGKVANESISGANQPVNNGPK